MFSKIVLVSIFGTSLIGTGAAGGFTPTGMELACGAVRIETGFGQGVHARLDNHSNFALTINLNGERSLKLKF